MGSKKGGEMTVSVEGDSPGVTKSGPFSHTTLGAKPVSRMGRGKLSVKVVWRFGNPGRPGRG